MASQARKAFDDNCKDVAALLATHTLIAGASPGRKYKVEVLNKSAIVLITSFWEAYCEDIASEALSRIIEEAPNSSQLPKYLRNIIARELKEEKDELAVWSLSGDGWRDMLRGRSERIATERNRRLNTPKTVQIDEHFVNSVGVANVSGSWNWQGMSVKSSRSKLDKYVSLRGTIAHRGRLPEGTVRKSDVEDYYGFIRKVVAKTGGKVNTTVRATTGKGLW